MSPFPRSLQLAFGAGAVLVTLLLARTSWSLTAKMVAFAAIAGVLVLVALRFERRLPRTGPEPAGPDEVMPGARAHVDEFELAGFRRLGGLRWALRGRLVISSVLMPASSDRYAIVTDRVLELASRFGERLLITTNSGRAPIPEDVLRQVVQPGRPGELVAAHQAALDELARHGVVADRFGGDDEVLRFVRTVEERALRNARVPSAMALLTRSPGADDPELRDDDASRLRIASWLSQGAS